MDENEQLIKAAKALGINEILPEAYKDMLQPSVRKLGEGLVTIASAVNICLAPLEAGIWGYEQIKLWLSLRVTQILAERNIKVVKEPPLSISGPLVFQLLFAQSEENLKEMYASLLASAMDGSESAHPAFVTIIQQLTSDEAKILRYVAQLDDEWPSLDSSDNDVYAIENTFKQWGMNSNVSNLDSTLIYLDNLIRLRIFQKVYTNEVEYLPSDRFRDDDPK